jgi:hypothetical protein
MSEVIVMSTENNVFPLSLGSLPSSTPTTLNAGTVRRVISTESDTVPARGVLFQLCGAFSKSFS